MSTTIQPLFQPVQLGSSPGLLFTATSPTRIDQFAISNPSETESYQAFVYWVPPGGAAGAANAIVPGRYITPLEPYVASALVGQVLGVGDTLWGSASSAGKLNAFASGTVSS